MNPIKCSSFKVVPKVIDQYLKLKVELFIVQNQFQIN